MAFKEIYRKELINAPKQDINGDAFPVKPIMTNGIISPESTIIIQAIFDIGFQLDKSGMEKVIEMLENKWNASSKDWEKNFLQILTDIYSITNEYLGGQGIEKNRKEAYSNAEDSRLNLSEIEGKKIGLCAERAAIGHQLLTILQQAGIINYKPYFTMSKLTTDDRIEPHAFIVLKHKEDASKQFIFDIENPLKYKMRNSDKEWPGVAIYPITEKEFEAFANGESISPKSIYEQSGASIVGTSRAYGNGKFSIGKEIIA